MGIYEVVQEIVAYITASYKSLERMFSYVWYVIMGVLLALCVWLGYIGFQYYTERKNQAAQKQLVEYIEEYQKVRKKKDADELKHVEALFALGYEQHGNSQLGPVFLSYKADVQAQQGDVVQAADTMRQAIASLSVTSPLLYIYKTKRALMLLDSVDEVHKKDGEQLLESVARDEKNLQRDYALFYLGRYYWVQNNMTQAQNIWQELVALQSPEKEAHSPWITQAEAKLRSLQS